MAKILDIQGAGWRLQRTIYKVSIISHKKKEEVHKRKTSISGRS